MSYLHLDSVETAWRRIKGRPLLIETTTYTWKMDAVKKERAERKLRHKDSIAMTEFYLHTGNEDRTSACITRVA